MTEEKVEQLIVHCLNKGYTQVEIAETFKKEGIKPNSLSSIEKHLKRIRAKHGAKTMYHLGIILTLQGNGKH